MNASATPPKHPWLENFPSGEVRALDPRRHTLIEASAGTGKTFAVEHLVLRLLMENPDWLPEEILLLSFTEKTAADLRTRIRALLHRQVRKPGPEDAPDKAPIPGWSDEDLKRLQTFWMQADDLAIHTLHGFCQSSLRRDPLAGNVLIRDEVADDRSSAENALENLLRGPWAKDPARLAKLRDSLNIGSGENWRKKLVRIALAWHPWRGDTIEPAPGPEVAPALEAEVLEACARLRHALAGVNAGSIPLRHFISLLPGKNPEGNGFARVDVLLGKTEDPWAVLLCMLETFYGTYKHGTEKAGKTNAYKKGFSSLLVSTRGRDIASLAEWSRLATACDAALALGMRIEYEKAMDALRLQAAVVQELRAELTREKIRRGVISYDDMPANLVRALRRNTGLATRIRRRYKACIVDEFQDTDPVQWEILESLCLEGPEKEGQDDGGRATLPLFLVGDPKQAIYGFRGGDLRTYLVARAAFRERAAGGRAQGFGLEANFRSRRTLIEALNATFVHENWFGAPAETPPDTAWRLPAESDKVAFTPARAGRADETAPAPRVHLRDFTQGDFAEGSGPKPEKAALPSKRDVERAVRRWIAARIVAAIQGGRSPGEIAVLVRKNAEGEAVERLLRRCGVPCRVRRRGGVYTGAAADALRLLVEWIGDASDPDAQARILLLPFAREDANDLPRGRPTTCPPLIARWASFAQAGRWPEFFDSVRREGGHRERLAAVSPSEAERFDRLAQALAEAGSVPGTSVRALCDHFDSMRRGESSGEPGAESAEGGQDAVSIMTLHMSKGLEFPVVFIDAAGEGARSDYYVLRPQGETGFRIVLDLNDPHAREDHKAQERGEEQRLFYVAFTRARDELHIPLLPEKFRKGSAGPLGGFAAEALRSAAESKDTKGLFHWDVEVIEDRVLATGEASQAAGMTTGPVKPPPESVKSREEMLADSRETFSRRRKLASYSGLSTRARTEMQAAPKAEGQPDELVGEDGTRMLREEIHILSAEENHLTAEDLPPGAASGTALHAIFEHTVFSSARETTDPAAWLSLPGHRERVEEALRRESVDPAYAPAAARAVWNTLRMPLPDPAGGAPFRLADIVEEGNYRHEVEFLLPFDAASPTPPLSNLPEDVARRGSFLWGFIDLVFRHEGRYYLLDWKSNLLPAYDGASVRRSMDDHHYDLQWKLYSIALDRWLGKRLPGYDPALHFGGVHYLYLRGASPAFFSGFTGRPTPSQLREDFPAEIARLLGAETRETP